MATTDPRVLELSGDSQALMKTAVEFAKSRFPTDHDTLLDYLSREEFLDRLDSEDDYLGPPTQLRLARVIKFLMDNPSPDAQQVLVSLTQKSAFVSYEPRQDLLIRALVSVRPAPMEAVQFWNQHSQPDATFLHVTIAALCDNGTRNVLALLVQKMADPELEDEGKIAWMRDPILRHRNDPPMLEACSTMLANSLPEDLRPSLVESLFDYHPEWYLSCNPPKAPPRLEMTPEARPLLRMIGNYALQTIPLEPSTRVAVEAGLKQIGSE
jgi:hypothetical protein